VEVRRDSRGGAPRLLVGFSGRMSVTTPTTSTLLLAMSLDAFSREMSFMEEWLGAAIVGVLLTGGGGWLIGGRE
jgi:hypothetical protein